jgi:arsenate reductase
MAVAPKSARFKSLTVTIYHNPRCSKSRATLQLLLDRGIEPRIVEYLKEPPSAAEIEEILKVLSMEPRDLMRKNETVYRELELDNSALTHKQLIVAMTQHPVLIERPIVRRERKAAIGRPPERVLEIL